MQKANCKSTVAFQVHSLNSGIIRCLFRYSRDAGYINLTVEIWSAAPEAAGRDFPFPSLFAQLLGFSFGFGSASVCRLPQGVFWEVWGLLPAFSRFLQGYSTCRCISDVFVGRKVISTSYSSAIMKVSLLCPFKRMPAMGRLSLRATAGWT